MENESPARTTPRPGEDKPPIAGKPAGHDPIRTPVTRPPILASDALREEVAPLEPGRIALRFWVLGIGLAMALSGLAVYLKWAPGTPEHAQIAWAVAAVVLVAAIVPYKARGALIVLAGLATIVLGLFGRGPLADLVVPKLTSVGVEISRVLAATVLPAALLFRARYRAYRGARIALIVGLVLAVPAAVHAGLVVASGPMAARLTSGLAILSILASCIGFMGAGTTGASTAWAVIVVVAFGADVAVRAVWMNAGNQAGIAQVHAGVMLMLTCALVTIGLFKGLASLFAVDARLVDVLGKEDEPNPASEAGEGSD
jgi:hypothetical protein